MKYVVGFGAITLWIIFILSLVLMFKSAWKIMSASIEHPVWDKLYYSSLVGMIFSSLFGFSLTVLYFAVYSSPR